MGQALYRKYRSKSFDEVVGQNHITKTLQNAIRTGRISHAYLFTGPRGVGKTSVARILAHEVNDLKYVDETIHLDIIEIDAASNRRIDEIRELRDRVRIAPTSSKYKVYIIDEVHMLTREAFNALLKTLEEPPAHCIFILATTEAHKLPETIISRTQRFEFKSVNKFEVTEHLKEIATKEKISISQEALELLAAFGEGSFRDSISYLDQLSSVDKKIGLGEVSSLLGLPPTQEIEGLIKAINSDSTSEILTILKVIEMKGVNAVAVANAIADKLRKLALSDTIDSWQIKLLADLLLVSTSPRPQEKLEVILLQTLRREPVKLQEEKSKNPKTHITSTTTETEKNAVTELDDKKTVPSLIIPKNDSFDMSLWEQVILRSKHEDASVYTALRLAEPNYSNGKLVLSFQFPLHKKKLEQAKNKELLAKLIQDIWGSKIEIETEVNKPLIASNSREHAPNVQTSKTISNIFGNAEVIGA